MGRFFNCGRSRVVGRFGAPVPQVVMTLSGVPCWPGLFDVPREIRKLDAKPARTTKHRQQKPLGCGWALRSVVSIRFRHHRGSAPTRARLVLRAPSHARRSIVKALRPPGAFLTARVLGPMTCRHRPIFPSCLRSTNRFTVDRRSVAGVGTFGDATCLRRDASHGFGDKIRRRNWCPSVAGGGGGQVSLNRNHRVVRGATPLIRTGSCLKKDRSGDTCPRRYRAAMPASWPIWLSVLHRASATKCACYSFFVPHDRTLPACVLKAKLRQRPKRLTEGLPRLQPLSKENPCDSPVVSFCCTARQNSNWR